MTLKELTTAHGIPVAVKCTKYGVPSFKIIGEADGKYTIEYLDGHTIAGVLNLNYINDYELDEEITPWDKA